VIHSINITMSKSVRAPISPGKVAALNAAQDALCKQVESLTSELKSASQPNSPVNSPVKTRPRSPHRAGLTKSDGVGDAAACDDATVAAAAATAAAALGEVALVAAQQELAEVVVQLASERTRTSALMLDVGRNRTVVEMLELEQIQTQQAFDTLQQTHAVHIVQAGSELAAAVASARLDLGVQASSTEQIVSGVTSERDQARQQVEHLERKLKQHQTRADNLASELSTALGVLESDHATEVGRLLDGLTAAATETADCNSAADAMLHERDAALAELVQYKEQLHQSQDSAATLSITLQNVQKAAAADAATFETNIATLRSELLSEVAGHDTSIAAATAAMTDEIASLHQLVEQERASSTFAIENASTEMKLATETRFNESAEATYATHQAELSRFQTTVDQLYEELLLSNTKLADVAGKCSEQDDQIATQAATINVMEMEVAEAKLKCESIMKKHQQGNDQLNEYRNTVQRLQADMGSVKAVLDDATEMYKEQHQEQLETHESVVAQLQTDLKSATAALEAADAAGVHTQQQHEQLEQYEVSVSELQSELYSATVALEEAVGSHAQQQQQQIIAHEAAVAKLQAEIASATIALANESSNQPTQEEFDEQSIIIATLQSELSTAALALNDATLTRTQLEDRAKQLAVVVENKEEIIASLQSDVEQATGNEQIAVLMKDLASVSIAHAARLSEMQGLLDEKQQELADALEEVEDVRADVLVEVADLNAQNASTTAAHAAKLGDIQRLLDEKQQELGTVMKEVEDLNAQNASITAAQAAELREMQSLLDEKQQRLADVLENITDVDAQSASTTSAHAEECGKMQVLLHEKQLALADALEMIDSLVAENAEMTTTLTHLQDDVEQAKTNMSTPQKPDRPSSPLQSPERLLGLYSTLKARYEKVQQTSSARKCDLLAAKKTVVQLQTDLASTTGVLEHAVETHTQVQEQLSVDHGAVVARLQSELAVATSALEDVNAAVKTHAQVQEQQSVDHGVAVTRLQSELAVATATLEKTNEMHMQHSQQQTAAYEASADRFETELSATSMAEKVQAHPNTVKLATKIIELKTELAFAKSELVNFSEQQAQMQAQIVEYDATIRQLRAQLTMVEADYAAQFDQQHLQHQEQHQQQEINHEIMVAQLQADLLTAITGMDEATVVHNQLQQQQVLGHEAVVVALHSQLSFAASALEAAQEHHLALETEQNEMHTANIKKLQTDFTSDKEADAANLAAVQCQLSERSALAENDRATITRMKTAAATLEASNWKDEAGVNELRAQLTESQVRFQQVEASWHLTKGDLSAAHSATNANAKALAAAQQEITNLQAEVQKQTAAAREIERAEGGSAVESKPTSDTTDEQAALFKKCKLFEARNSKLKDRVTELRQKYNAALEKARRLKASKAEIREERHVLAARVKVLEVSALHSHPPSETLLEQTPSKATISIQLARQIW
jgi:chromosome segregation ATPase